MGEESNINPQDMISSVTKHNDDSSQSFLSIVHEKNKTIEKLQKQLYFQKLQLKYYLGKTFRNAKIIELSKTCSSHNIEESLPVTFAVNRFYNTMGIKSKIMALHDRMCNIDVRINNLLHIQECFLRKVISKICDVAQNGNDIEVKLYFKKMLSTPEYMDMFSNLLNANIGLRKNLDTYRICCDRLIVIEDERNMIVEQVYSLPVEQRSNCNYLIGIQIEKVQLQNRMKEIVKDQSLLRDRIEQLNSAEEHIRKLQEEYKMTHRMSTEHVTDMLRKVNNEAVDLMTKSNQQREKYTKEIVKLKSENSKISKLLERVRTSIQEKELVTRDSLKLDAVYSAGLFQALDKEITQIVQENETNKESAVQKVKSECQQLSKRLQKSQSQNITLEKELYSVQIEYQEAKRQWKDELARVQQELDDYKAQVEDLEAIRTAYAQLVESRADMLGEAEKQSLVQIDHNKKRISELEDENIRLTSEVAELKEETRKQKSKIIHLSGLILNLDNNDQQVLGSDQTEMKDVGSGDIQDGNNTNLGITNSCATCKENYELEKGIIFQELEKSNVSTHDLIKLAKTNQLDAMTSTILQDLSSSSNECHCCALSSDSQNISCSQRNDLRTHEPLNEKKTIDIEDEQLKITKEKIDSTFGIETPHQGRKQQTFRGILESRRHEEGILKREEPSKIAVRVRWVAPNKNSKTNSDSWKPKDENAENNEYEVLSVCTLETLSHTLSPVDNAISYNMHTVNEKEESYVSQKIDATPIQVTYRDSDYRAIATDSDPTMDEFELREVETRRNTRVHEMRQKPIVGNDESQVQSNLQTNIEGRVKSMSFLN